MIPCSCVLLSLRQREEGDMCRLQFGCSRELESGLGPAGCTLPGHSRGYAALVFGRFTERARQVVVLSQDEARLLKHNYIGTEHLLLGLIRDEALAAQALAS